MSSRAREFLAAALLLACATLLPYLQTHGFELLQYDDDKYITDNAMVCGGLSANGVRWAFTSAGYQATWHPVTWLSLMTDVSLFGVNSGAMHLVNALLHAAGAAVLLALLLRLTGSLPASLAAAALWALHPLRVESVAWVCQRKDVLGNLLGLLAVLCHLAAAAPRPCADDTKAAPRAAAWRIASILLFALAFMAKPTVVTFPVLAGLLEYAATGRIRWRNLAGAACVAVAGMLVTMHTQSLGGAIASDVSLPARVLNAASSFGIYLRQTLLPVGLAVPYLLGPAVVWQVAAGIAAGILFLLLFWRTGLSRTARERGAAAGGANTAALLPYAAGLGWFVVALGPMIGLVQLSFQAHADRFTGWPSIGLAVALAWGLRQAEAQCPACRRPLRLAAAGAAVVLGVLTCLQVAHWRNTETLFNWTNQVTPRNDIAHSNLGVHLFRSGRRAEGLEHLRLAVAYYPSAFHLSDLTQALISEGQLDEAERYAVRLRDTDPRQASLGWLALARIAWRRGAFAAAEQHLREAIKRDAVNAELWSNLGNALYVQKRTADAAEAWRQALALDPTLAGPREGLRHCAPAAVP